MIVYIKIKLTKHDVSEIIMGRHDTKRLTVGSIISSVTLCSDSSFNGHLRGEMYFLSLILMYIIIYTMQT